MESSLILIKGCLTLLRTLRNKGLSLGSRNYTVKAKPHSRTLAPIPFYIQRHWGSESWTMLVELHLNMPLPASNALPPCPILQLLLMTSLPFCLEPHLLKTPSTQNPDDFPAHFWEIGRENLRSDEQTSLLWYRTVTGSWGTCQCAICFKCFTYINLINFSPNPIR